MYVFEKDIRVKGTIVGNTGYSGVHTVSGQFVFAYSGPGMTTSGWQQATTWVQGQVAVFDSGIVGSGRYGFIGNTSDTNWYFGRTTLVDGTTAPTYAFWIKNNGDVVFNQKVGVGTSGLSLPYRFTVSNFAAEGVEFNPGAGANVNQTLHYNRNTSNYISHHCYAAEHVFYCTTTAAYFLVGSNGVCYSYGTGSGFFGYDRAPNASYCGLYRSTTTRVYDSSYGDFITFDSPSGNVLSLVSANLSIEPSKTVALLGGNRYSGVGISWPASGSVTTNPNSLDCYEEGDWNATSGTANVAVTNLVTGRYVRIGAFVMASCYIQVTNNTGAGITNYSISNWPFTCSAAYYGGVYSYYNQGNYADNYHNYLNAGTNTSLHYWQNNMANGVSWTPMYTATYMTDANF